MKLKTSKNKNQQQQKPIDTTNLVKKDLESRAKKGKETYGQRLSPFVERDSLQDVYEEVLDQAVYLKNEILRKQIKKEKDMKDILELGIPNVCFSYAKNLKKDDERLEFYRNERKKYGFDSTETWSLYKVIAAFILPRLRMYKDKCPTNPMSLTKTNWNRILNKMIKSFDLISIDEIVNENEKIVEEGLDLFRKWFFALWW